MAIFLTAHQPATLLNSFKHAIDTKRVLTWTYDADGDFTHSVDQWRNQAWLRPSIASGQLVLNILHPQGQAISKEVYAVYHGRFIEAMLAHCDQLFSLGQTSALPMGADKVG